MQPPVPLCPLLFDRGSLAEALGAMARFRHKDGSSLLQKKRTLATPSVLLKDATGPPSPGKGALSLWKRWSRCSRARPPGR
jgi:hypothetical protein